MFVFWVAGLNPAPKQAREVVTYPNLVDPNVQLVDQFTIDSPVFRSLKGFYQVLKKGRFFRHMRIDRFTPTIFAKKT